MVILTPKLYVPSKLTEEEFNKKFTIYGPEVLNTIFRTDEERQLQECKVYAEKDVEPVEKKKRAIEYNGVRRECLYDPDIYNYIDFYPTFIMKKSTILEDFRNRVGGYYVFRNFYDIEFFTRRTDLIVVYPNRVIYDNPGSPDISVGPELKESSMRYNFLSNLAEFFADSPNNLFLLKANILERGKSGY